MFPCDDSKTLSVCPHPEKRYHHSFVNISPTLVIDTSMERSSRVLHHGNPKNLNFSQNSSKFEFWLLTKSWNHLSFVNISPTLVIDTSMERSSRVLHHGNPKIWIFFQKSSKFEFWLLTKSWNHLSFVNISPTLVIDTSIEWSWRLLHHGNAEMWKFFKKFEIDKIEFCPYPDFPYAKKKKSPWLREFFNFFSKKFEIELDLYFDLCWRAEIIQVGLNMHLYVDIGDASSSLWGSTSSYSSILVASMMMIY